MSSILSPLEVAICWNAKSLALQFHSLVFEQGSKGNLSADFRSSLLSNNFVLQILIAFPGLNSSFFPCFHLFLWLNSINDLSLHSTTLLHGLEITFRQKSRWNAEKITLAFSFPLYISPDFSAMP